MTQAGDADERGGPLTGVRILELGNFVAAPSAGRLLAEFGAEVIKVEQPGVGDQVRRWRLFRGETSMMWRTLGRNKKSGAWTTKISIVRISARVNMPTTLKSGMTLLPSTSIADKLAPLMKGPKSITALSRRQLAHGVW